MSWGLSRTLPRPYPLAKCLSYGRSCGFPVACDSLLAVAWQDKLNLHPVRLQPVDVLNGMFQGGKEAFVLVKQIFPTYGTAPYLGHAFDRYFHRAIARFAVDGSQTGDTNGLDLAQQEFEQR